MPKPPDPAPPVEADPLAAVLAVVTRIERAIAGYVDEQGTHHRGLMDRVAALERALTWVTAIGTAAVVSLVSAIVGGLGGAHK